MPSCLLIICLSLLWIGCGRQPVASQPASDPGSAPPAESAALSDAQTEEALRDLTQAVRKFAAEQQRAPKSLDELVAHGDLTQVPAAPAGKKFAIGKDLQVRLVHQ